MSSLRQRALKGSFVTILGFGGAQFLRLASNLVLTRLLFPEIFGLMALVQVFLTGLEMVSDLGLTPSIVQNRRGDDRAFLETAWTLQILRGALLWLAACAIAPAAAAFYDQPILAQLLPAGSLSMLILGFSSIGIATASRHLRLVRVMGLDLGTQLFGIVVMVVLAWLTGSIWSLVIGTLASNVAKAALSHLILKAPARLRLERAAALEMLHFGKYILLGSLAGFMLGNADRLVLGKFVTLTDLAIYNIGFFLATVPLMVSHQVIQKVMLPLYAQRPPKESAENRLRLSQARCLLTLAAVTSSLLLAFAGDWLVRTLYDARYHGAGPVLVLMCLAVLPRVVTASYGTLLLAEGNSRHFTLLMIMGAVLQTGFIYLGVRLWGLPGVILAPLPASLIGYPVVVMLVRRYRGWDPLHDALFAALSLLGAGLVLWTYAAVLAPLVPVSVP
jgi:O-antigen/teichoic acid export membrane protein